MKLKYAALVALAGAIALAPSAAQVPATDFSYSPVSPGGWNYRAVTGGSEASFVDGTGASRMIVGCGKLTRLVTLSRVIAAPASTMSIWTSSGSRQFASRYDQPSGRVIAQLGASDPFLDAIVFSRGRFVVSMPGSVPLIMPSGTELAHIVEDCRG
jgi:hypothetical protein